MTISTSWRKLLLMSSLIALGVTACSENEGGQTGAQSAGGEQAGTEIPQDTAAGVQNQGENLGQQAAAQQNGQGEQTAQGSDTESGVQNDLAEAAQVLQQMRASGELQQPLSEAQGVFVVPDYATAALLVGGSGGEGVLLTRQDGELGSPIFYDIGSISAGLQAGAAAGSIAMILMSDDAVQAFNNQNNFSLNAEAGLSIVNWSTRAQGSLGKGGDVIVWTDTEGLLGELSLSVADINFDEEESQAYYGQPTSPDAIMAGRVQNPKPDLFASSTPQ